MKNKKEESQEITYISPLSSATIKSVISEKIKFFSHKYREFLYEDKGENEIWIGVEKGDHAGYWYIATLEDIEEGCKISGKIIYDPYNTKKHDSKMSEWIFTILLLIICIIPFLIWLLVYGIYTLIFNRKSKEKLLDIFMCEYLDCKK